MWRKVPLVVCRSFGCGISSMLASQHGVGKHDRNDMRTHAVFAAASLSNALFVLPV